MKNSFYLVIPSQQQAPELARWYQEKNLKHWLDELPIINPALSTRMLLDLVQQANQLVMPAEKRLDVQELLRPAYLTIVENLRARLLYGGLPKSDNEQKVFAALTQLEKAFTLGYWIATREVTQRDLGWFKSKQVSLAIHRSLLGLANIVVSHYLMNTPIPDWVWIDLHSLYLLAVKLKKETVKVAASGLDNDQPAATIEEIYLQIVLLSLSQPDSLTPREILHVHGFVQPLCEYLALQRAPVKNQEKQCLIQTDEDLPPFFSDDSTKYADTSLLFINFHKFLKILAQANKFIDRDSVRFGAVAPGNQERRLIAPELYHSLVLHWQGKRYLGPALFADRLPRRVAVGLDVNANLGKRSDAEADEQHELTVTSASPRSLAVVPHQANLIAIGSLVGFRKEATPHNQANLGVISKISNAHKGKELVFEIRQLAPVFYPVSLTANVSDWETAGMNGLVYSDPDKKTRLILESYSLKEGDVLWMRLNQEEFPIILRNRENIGIGYWGFECRRIEEKGISSGPPNADAVDNRPGFDFT
ncbi:MAG: hypothetical protein RQ715_05940 [Methylococcales bacterium]|nr:hypothetical protein [Methylococcales bacterium]